VYAIAVLLIFQVISTTRTFPAYMKRYLDGRGVKDCWFVYFGEGVIDYSYYGFPASRSQLPMRCGRENLPRRRRRLMGPVLISAGCLSGWESGPGGLDPYEQFKSLQAAAVIDYGVFVFDGHFQIPLAASLTHSHNCRKPSPRPSKPRPLQPTR
jgi:hypothetical protein